MGTLSRRRFLKAAATSLGTGLLAACGASPTPEVIEKPVVQTQIVERVVTATPGPAQNIELVYCTWRPLAEQELLSKSIVAQFNVKQPRIKVKAIGAAYGDYNTKVLTMAAAGSPIDVIHLDNVFIAPWSEQGMLFDLSPNIALSPVLSKPENMWPNMMKSCSWAGKLYGVPFGVSAGGLYYNTDMFDTAGLKYPDATWRPGDIATVAAKLTHDKQFGIVNDTGAEFALGFFGAHLVDDVFAPTKCTLDDPLAIEAIDWWGNTIYKGSPRDVSFITGNEFMQKTVAMKFFWASQVVVNRMNMKDSNWDVIAAGEISPVPHEKQSFSYGVHCQGIGAATRYKSEAWALVDWLTNDYVDAWCKEAGYAVPALQSVALSASYLPTDKPPKGLRSVVEQLKGGFSPWMLHPKRNEINTEFARATDQVRLGMAKAKDVLPPLVKVIDGFLQPKK